jgi:hypothetical protein
MTAESRDCFDPVKYRVLNAQDEGLAEGWHSERRAWLKFKESASKLK